MSSLQQINQSPNLNAFLNIGNRFFFPVAAAAFPPLSPTPLVPFVVVAAAAVPSSCTVDLLPPISGLSVPFLRLPKAIPSEVLGRAFSALDAGMGGGGDGNGQESDVSRFGVFLRCSFGLLGDGWALVSVVVGEAAALPLPALGL